MKRSRCRRRGHDTPPVDRTQRRTSGATNRTPHVAKIVMADDMNASHTMSVRLAQNRQRNACYADVMTAYVALLRAINVGGTGRLDMAELRQLCEGCGFTSVSTFIQSGNVVFQSKRSEASVQKLLDQTLAEKMGKPIGVLIRTAEELSAVLDRNPYPEAEPSQVIVLFLDAPARRGALDDIETPGGERLVASGREIFIHYPEGQGKSKLKLPFQKTGTGRNLNTVRKLCEMLAELTVPQ